MFLFFLAFGLIMFLLFFLWGAKQTCLSPPRMIFFANYVYFFILYIILAPDLASNYELALSVALVFCLSFLISEYLLKLILPIHYTIKFRDPFIRIQPNRRVIYIYITVIFVSTILSVFRVGTTNPIDAFYASFQMVGGKHIEAGSYVKILLISSITWLLFMLSAAYAIAQKKHFLLFFVLLSFLYHQLYLGNKSALLLPIIFLLLLKYRDRNNINTLKMFVAMAVGALVVSFSLVALDKLRTGTPFDLNNFLVPFVTRIDYIPTLSGYINNLDQFSHEWPPVEFIMKFFPYHIAEFIGLDKSRISFDVYYTQFAYNRFDHFSSGAGVGIAATNETLRPFSLHYPFFAAIITGFVASFFTSLVANILDYETKRKGVFMFATIVPSLHIIAFFEPGPTIFFNILLNILISFIIVLPILYVSKSINFVKD